VVKQSGQLARQLTLYASEADYTLRLAQGIRLGQLRAGQGGENLVVLEGLHSIDTTTAPGSALGHNAFIEGALADLRSLLWFGLIPDKRCPLERRPAPGIPAWNFTHSYADCKEFDTAAVLIRSAGTVEDARQFAKGERDRSIGNKASSWRKVLTEIDWISEALGDT